MQPIDPITTKRERRLEMSSYWSFAFSVLSHIGEGPPYASAVSLLFIIVHHTKRGRHLLAAFILGILSFLPDLFWMGTLNSQNKWNYVPFLIIPLNAVAKLFALYYIYRIFISVGGMWSLVENHGLFETSERTNSGSEYAHGRTYSDIDGHLGSREGLYNAPISMRQPL